MNRLINFCFVLCIFLSSCSSLSTGANPSMTATISNQATSTPPSTSALLPTPTLPLVPYVPLTSLPEGIYYAYSELYSDDRSYLAVMTADGDFLGYLGQTSGTAVSISPNLEYLLDFPTIQSLITGEQVYYEGTSILGVPSWAPNSTQIVAQCPMPDLEGPNTGLCLFSLQDGSTRLITNNPYPKNCFAPSWSPNGLWIAYWGYEDRSGLSNYTGMHLLNTSCFSSQNDCWRDDPAIDLQSPYTWSPDGSQVAGIYNRFENGDYVFDVRVYDINRDGVPSLSEKYSIGEQILDISWLPDGERMAVWSDRGSYLLTLSTGELNFLFLPRYGQWFSVPR